jgi:hypothetical protein
VLAQVNVLNRLGKKLLFSRHIVPKDIAFQPVTTRGFT